MFPWNLQLEHRPASRVQACALALRAAVLLSCGMLATWTPVHAEETTAVTVVLVRHAERAQDDPRDPNLSEAGQARAQELARVLGDLTVSHLFASEYKRTQQTLAPLAQQVGQDVQERSARQPEALIDELRGLPDGAVAVVAGHSNTVPDLIARLGGQVTGLEEHPKHGWLLPHEEYARLFIVTLQRDGEGVLHFAQCLELRFGEESTQH